MNHRTHFLYCGRSFGLFLSSSVLCELRTLDDARQVHFVEAYLHADGACHETVIVVAFHCLKASFLCLNVGEVFVKAFFLALDIEVFPNDGFQVMDDNLLCKRVGVEAVFAWHTLANILRRAVSRTRRV